jgi:hypothetical protein
LKCQRGVNRIKQRRVRLVQQAFNARVIQVMAERSSVQVPDGKRRQLPYQVRAIEGLKNASVLQATAE